MLLHQLGKSPLARLRLLAHDQDHRRGEHFAKGVDHRDLTTVSKPRVDREHSAVPHGRLQQQFSQIANKHLDRVLFGLFSLLSPHLPRQAGRDQPRHGVANAGLKKLGVTVLGWNRQLARLGNHLLDVGVHSNTKDLGSLAAIDCQDSMRRGLRERLSKVKIVLESVFKLLAFFLPF